MVADVAAGDALDRDVERTRQEPDRSAEQEVAGDPRLGPDLIARDRPPDRADDGDVLKRD